MNSQVHHVLGDMKKCKVVMGKRGSQNVILLIKNNLISKKRK